MIAQALLEHQGLEIITNNLNVAAILQHKEDFTVIIAGGQVRSRDGGIIGEATIDFINQFKVDYGIIGISGIDEDGSLLEFDYQEVRVAQAIIANSRRVYLAADYSKFHRNPVVRQGNISQLDALFTDRKPPRGDSATAQPARCGAAHCLAPVTTVLRLWLRWQSFILEHSRRLE